MLAVLWSLLVNGIIRKGMESFQSLQWRHHQRGMTMFLNVSVSMRSFSRIQLYVNLFQYLSLHNVFYLVYAKLYNEQGFIQWALLLTSVFYKWLSFKWLQVITQHDPCTVGGSIPQVLKWPFHASISDLTFSFF